MGALRQGVNRTAASTNKTTLQAFQVQVQAQEATMCSGNALRWTWPSSERLAMIAVQGMCTFWFALMAWSFTNGPRLRAEAEWDLAALIEQENQSACQRLGMPSGSEMYFACASELNNVRQHHAERLNSGLDIL